MMDIDMDIFEFKNADSQAVDGMEAVFPIFDKNEDGSPKFLGTGFFIGSNGIFMSAKHVFEGASSPYVIQRLPSGELVIRGVAQIDSTHRGDVCIGLLFGGAKRGTGELLTNKKLSLSSYIPGPGETVSTYAYPETTVESQGEGDEMHTRMDIQIHQYHGVVTQVQPEGVGLAQTGALVCTIDSIPGNSGGPVFSPAADGGVLGINSSGMRGAYHVVSLLKDIEELKLDNISLPGEPIARTVSVREFIELGYVSVL